MTPYRRAAAAVAALALLAAPAAAARPVGGCQVFPASNPWNQRVDGLPVATGSAALVRAMAIPHLHPDFGTVYGIPFNVVPADQATSAVSFDYADESDRVRYPIPASPRIEGGSDRHLLMVQQGSCRLFELYAARRAGGGWHAGSGAVWSLGSNALRPAGWTSADAAGLPILPGLARADEVAQGGIDHAIRMTLSETQKAWMWPARHYASDATAPWLAPMGLRLRLKASFRIDGRFGPQAAAVLRALKTYGAIVADNGSSGYVTGAPSANWDNDDLHALHLVPGSALEVVDVSSLPGAAAPRLWNSRATRGRSAVVVRGFLTARAAVRVVIFKGGRVIARGPVVRRRGGLVTLRVHPRPGARDRMVVAGR